MQLQPSNGSVDSLFNHFASQMFAASDPTASIQMSVINKGMETYVSQADSQRVSKAAETVIAIQEKIDSIKDDPNDSDATKKYKSSARTVLLNLMQLAYDKAK